MSEASTSGESYTIARNHRKRKLSVDDSNPVYDTKSDCFPCQCLSVVFRDTKRVKISDDRLTAFSSEFSGYTTVLATCPAMEGSWYFEVRVEELEGHFRVGWSTRRTRYDVPIGVDCFSYGVRDMDCSRAVQACKSVYGNNRKLVVGDVIGCWIQLPISPSSPRESTLPTDAISLYPNLLCDPENPGEIDIADQIIDSRMGFSVNGENLGIAFTGLLAGEFHPAVSLFGKTKLRVNFGPNFANPPVEVSAVKPAAELFVRKELIKPKRRPLNFIPKGFQRINS